MLEGIGMPLVYSTGGGGREQRRPMWTQHEKAVLRLLMRQYAGVTEFDPPDVHKHPIRNEMWRLLTARYNAHPHVRSRDTKQLRKAWENLKYRARKLGSEAQRTGKAQNNANDTAAWPLDGVTLPGIQQQTPPTEAGEVADWKEADEEGQRNYEEEEEAEKEVKDEIEEDVGEGHSVEGHEGSEERGAVLNLHPLVSSLLGGGLVSLASSLPFFTSPTSPLAPGLLLPQVVSSLAAVDSDQASAAIRSSMAVSAAASPPPAPATTTSDTSVSTSGVSVVLNGISQDLPHNLSTNYLSSRPNKLPKIEADDEFEADERVRQRVTSVEARLRQTEEHHQARLQLLRLQMTQAAAEHEAKMRVLAAQLQFWQRRLRGNQGNLSLDHDTDLEYDDTLP